MAQANGTQGLISLTVIKLSTRITTGDTEHRVGGRKRIIHLILNEQSAVEVRRLQQIRVTPTPFSRAANCIIVRDAELGCRASALACGSPSCCTFWMVSEQLLVHDNQHSSGHSGMAGYTV